MKAILDYLKDNGIQDKVVHTRKKMGGNIPVLLSEVIAGYVEMPSDEEAIKIISTELRKCFNMGLRQSPTDAENSEFYAPYIELTIAPRLWKGLKQSQPTESDIDIAEMAFNDQFEQSKPKGN